MKSTLVLSLDSDNVMFLEKLIEARFYKDPNTFINHLIRQESQRTSFSDWQSGSECFEQMIEDFMHSQIPAAG